MEAAIIGQRSDWDYLEKQKKRDCSTRSCKPRNMAPRHPVTGDHDLRGVNDVVESHRRGFIRRLAQSQTSQNVTKAIEAGFEVLDDLFGKVVGLGQVVQIR